MSSFLFKFVIFPRGKSRILETLSMGLAKIHLKLENKPSLWNVATTSKKHMALHFTWGKQMPKKWGLVSS